MKQRAEKMHKRLRLGQEQDVENYCFQSKRMSHRFKFSSHQLQKMIV